MRGLNRNGRERSLVAAVIDKDTGLNTLDVFTPKGAVAERVANTTTARALSTAPSPGASSRARLTARRCPKTRLSKKSSGAPRSLADAMLGPPAEATAEADAAQGSARHSFVLEPAPRPRASALSRWG